MLQACRPHRRHERGDLIAQRMFPVRRGTHDVMPITHADRILVFG